MCEFFHQSTEFNFLWQFNSIHINKNEIKILKQFAKNNNNINYIVV